jgi:hypothetical protein
MKGRRRVLIIIRNTQKVYIPWEKMQFSDVTAGGIYNNPVFYFVGFI